MIAQSVLVPLACAFGLAAGNFVSPGLGKCLDIKAELKEDGTRETVEEMGTEDKPINMQLYKCHGGANQHYEIIGGTFRSYALKDDCLTAEKIEKNANVHLEKCVEGKAEQQWDLTGDGNVKIKGSDVCLDVKAALKKDGTREVWHEIKAHKEVNVHLYTCHDPETTKRVNQLWAWIPFKHGKAVTEKTQKFALQDLGLSGESRSFTPALMGMAGVGLFAAGALLGLRTRRQVAPALIEE